jgi:hypothetical protein
MPSPRQLRYTTIVFLIAFSLLLYKTSHLRNSRDVDFYTSTAEAMAAAKHPHHDPATVSTVDDDDEAMSLRLKAAADEAKKLANAKAGPKPDLPSKLVGVGSSAGGKKAEHDHEVKDTAADAKVEAQKGDAPEKLIGVGSSQEGTGANPVVAPGKDRNVAGRKKYPIEGEQAVVKAEESKEDHEVEAELNTILKKSPSKAPFQFRRADGPLMR